MNNTLVIGANGQIGQLLIPLLIANNQRATAMVRDSNSAAALQEAGANLFEADIEQDFSAAFDGCSSVVFTAGSGAKTGPDKTLLIDLWGAAKAMEYAKRAGVKRFIMVSSRGADNPDKGPLAIKPYLVAKHFADNHLFTSDLDYTVLRPGLLINDAATGQVQTSRPANPKQQFITRADTASAIAFALNNPHTVGKTYELYQGSLTLQQALC